MTKYAANAMLATRISFMNEIANLCERVGADVDDVRRGIGHDRRIGHHFLFPGVGYGGSCFPKDVKAVIHTAHENGIEFPLLQRGRGGQRAQKRRAGREGRRGTSAATSRGQRFAVWGLAFKPRTDDMREAPSLTVIDGLLERGAAVAAHDPEALDRGAHRFFGDRVTYHRVNYEALDGADALLIVTEWNEFRRPDFTRMKQLLKRPLIFDGRNLYDPDVMRQHGFTYLPDRAHARADRASGGSVSRMLITGGAGFIGSHLCERFLAEGHDVICIDNFLTGTPDNIAHLFANPRFTFIQQDVTTYIYVKGPLDAILHFASPASPVDYLELPIQTLKVGSLGTHKALGLAKEKGARFLLASTSECYGDPLVHPQTEDYWGNVNPIGPRGVYDEAKRFAEAMTMAYHRTHGVDDAHRPHLQHLRPAHAAARRPRRARTSSRRRCAASRSPCTATARRRAASATSPIWSRASSASCASDYSGPVNIGNPREMTILQFAERIKTLTGSTSEIVFRPLPDDDPKQRQPDITRARKLLGWEPTVGLEEGLGQTIDYFRDKVPRHEDPGHRRRGIHRLARRRRLRRGGPRRARGRRPVAPASART